MAEKATAEESAAPLKVDVETCGVVMPISAIDDCGEAHWGEVLAIVSDAIADAGMKPNLVSNADEVGIIQKRIIQNLYDNPIVICDVSGKNPNVMFELGLRLAFDKPTIIIKDDKTDYSFDTAPIEHVPYPRDLRFAQIVSFKRDLTSKIKATLAKSRSDQSYTTFLKHFGEFTVVEIAKKEVSQQEYLSEELSDIRRYLRNIDLSMKRGGFVKGGSRRPGICLEGFSDSDAQEVASIIDSFTGVRSCTLDRVGNHYHIYPTYLSSTESGTERTRAELLRIISDFRARKG